MKTKKTVSEANFKTFGDLDLSKIPGSVTEIFTTNFERFGDCRTFEDVVALCHELIDGAGLNTEWTRKFFYRLAQIKEQSMNPRAAFEKAMTFVNNTRMKGMGLGMDRGGSRRRFYEGEEFDKCYVVSYSYDYDRDSLTSEFAYSNADDAKACASKVIEEIDYQMHEFDCGFDGPSKEDAMRSLVAAIKSRGSAKVLWQAEDDNGIEITFTADVKVDLASKYDDIDSTKIDDIVLFESISQNKDAAKMKKQYTKKQIMEAIKHWTNVLKQMNESSSVDGISVNVKFKTVSPDTTAFWSFDDYDFGIKETTDALDIFRQWKTEIEKYYSENGFTVEVVSLDGPVHYDNEFNVGLKCLGDCDKNALEEFNELS